MTINIPENNIGFEVIAVDGNMITVNYTFGELSLESSFPVKDVDCVDEVTVEITRNIPVSYFASLAGVPESDIAVHLVGVSGQVSEAEPTAEQEEIGVASNFVVTFRDDEIDCEFVEVLRESAQPEIVYTPTAPVVPTIAQPDLF